MKKNIIILLTILSIGSFVFWENLQWWYSREDEKIYKELRGENILLQGIDWYTFSILEFDYFSDENGVYRFTTNCREPSGYSKIPWADKDSFVPISIIYSKDSNSVFRWDDCNPYQKIPWADPSSFKIINDIYSYDKNYYYYHAKLITQNIGSYSIDNFSNLTVWGKTYLNGTPKDDIDTISFLVDKGIVARKNSTEEYRLQDKILRQEVIGMALKIRWIKLPEYYFCKDYFSDVRYNPQNNWVCRAMELAADDGIISRSNTRARPSDFITKSEALAILMKAAKISYPKNVSREGYSQKLLQWQVDLVDAAEKNSVILSGENFGANELAYRWDVFKWAKNIISDNWIHEGIDLSFKNVVIPLTLSVYATSYNGTFDFCVSGEKSLHDLGIEVAEKMISWEGLIINNNLGPILDLRQWGCFTIEFTQKIPGTLAFKIDLSNAVEEVNESNNFYLR